MFDQFFEFVYCMGMDVFCLGFFYVDVVEVFLQLVGIVFVVGYGGKVIDMGEWFV